MRISVLLGTLHGLKGNLMNSNVLLIVACIVFFIVSAAMAAFAGHHEREEGHDRGERREKSVSEGGSNVASAGAGAHANACGGCHFAYPPCLLPSASWKELLDNLDDHFGEAVELAPEDAATVRNYFETNAADRSTSKLSRKIVKSLSGKTPLRVTETPYIIHKHQDDDIPSNVFNRASVGSMANCTACHTTAGQGDFDDDDVRIPK